MARYTTTVRTDLPIEEAFARLADFSSAQHWDPGVKSASRAGSGEATLGETFDLLIGFGGSTLPMTYEIIELDAPHKVVLRSETSRLISLDAITFQANESGTDVTYDARLDLKGILRLGDPVLSLTFGRIGDRAAAGLRTFLGGVGVPQ